MGAPISFRVHVWQAPHPSRQQADLLDTSASDSITSNSDSIIARQAAFDCPLYDVSGTATSRRKLPCLSETPLCSASHTHQSRTLSHENSDFIIARQAGVDCPLYDVSGIATSRRKLPCVSETPLCSGFHTGMTDTCCTAQHAHKVCTSQRCRGFVRLRCPCQRTVPAVIVAVGVAVMSHSPARQVPSNISGQSFRRVRQALRTMYFFRSCGRIA